MSLRLEPIGEIPDETVRIARAAFPRGTIVTRLRDEFSVLYDDKDFRRLYSTRGQPALRPWRLALVTVFQFLEHLTNSTVKYVTLCISRGILDVRRLEEGSHLVWLTL